MPAVAIQVFRSGSTKDVQGIKGLDCNRGLFYSVGTLAEGHLHTTQLPLAVTRHLIRYLALTV